MSMFVDKGIKDWATRGMDGVHAPGSRSGGVTDRG
jgi:hypothetical protein